MVFHTGPDGSGSSKKRVSRAGKTSVILFSDDLLQDMWREFLGYVETLHRGKLTEKFQPLVALDFAFPMSLQTWSVLDVEALHRENERLREGRAADLCQGRKLQI